MEVQQAARIKLTDLIAPAFYKVHKDIKEGRHEYYNLYGGRGSGKSSFVSVELPLGMMQNPEANAAVFHKFSAMLRDSVYNQIQWGIDALGVSDYWRGNVNPMQFTYLPTGQKIIFRGLDKAQKTKSIKAATGFLNISGSRSWTSLRDQKRSEWRNSQFCVAVIIMSCLKRLIRRSIVTTGRINMCKLRIDGHTTTKATTGVCRVSGWEMNF